MLRSIVIGMLAWLSAVGCASAQVEAAKAWPERPVRVIMPYPAGGGGDGIARVLAQKLGEIFPQRFVVENRPGASGMVGTGSVAKAEPDGYTLLVASPVEVALAPSLFKAMSYDPFTELVPVSLIAVTPLIIAAHPTFPASTPAELLTLIRKQTTDYSHPGIGSSHHLTGEYVNALSDGKLLGIPYRGAAPALTDAVAGQVKLTVSGLPPVVQFLHAGTLKGLAVTSRQRSPLFPNIPALAETKGFEDVDTTNWFGLLAPRGISPVIVAKLHQAVVEALKDEKVRGALRAQAAEPVGGTPAEFASFIRDEASKYAKIIKLTGISAN